MPWIGAQLVIKQVDGLWGVLAELNPKKVTEMKAATDALVKAKGLVDIKLVQRLAGQLSWAAGLFRWIRSFNTALWAAISAHTSEVYFQKFSDKKRPSQLFFVMRIAQALRWIQMLLGGLLASPSRALTIRRWVDISSRAAIMRMSIRTDASPYGFGGILFECGFPVAWTAGDWTDTDLTLLRAIRGDPAWQAEWELLAALVSLDLWLPRLRGRALCLVQMDATAALYTIINQSGKTPVMNALAAEVALRMECADIQTIPEHLTGTLNFECDALSRLSQGASVPAALHDVRREVPKERSEQFFWAWPRTLSISTGRATLTACGPDDSVKGVEPNSRPLVRPGAQLLSRAKAKARRLREGEGNNSDALLQ